MTNKGYKRCFLLLQCVFWITISSYPKLNILLKMVIKRTSR